MKICITSTGDNLDSTVDPRFGRCKFFIIVDPDTMEFESISNENISASGGAGIKAGQLISEKKVKAVLTGNVGPNAFQTLNAAKIDIFSGINGTIKDAAIKYKNGELKQVNGPSVKSHFGMKGGS